MSQTELLETEKRIRQLYRTIIETVEKHIGSRPENARTQDLTNPKGIIVFTFEDKRFSVVVTGKINAFEIMNFLAERHQNIIRGPIIPVPSEPETRYIH